MSRLMKITACDILLAMLAIVMIVGGGVALAADQEIMLSPSNASQTVDTNFTLSIVYDVSDDNSSLSGLDISIHFDSSKIDFNDYGNFMDVGDMTSPPNVLPDSSDEDNDPSTDKRINMSWVSFSRKWPDVALPVALAELNFAVKADADLGDTAVKISVFDHDAKYGIIFSGTAITITNTP